MKKIELLKIVDDVLLEKLYGFCYARTNDSCEAQELCSDIIFALVKAAHTEGEVDNPFPYFWRIARYTYADFIHGRKQHSKVFYEGDPDEIFPFIAAEERESCNDELLCTVYRQIAFLSKAYREVMILFYLDGLSTAQIAVRQNVSETAVRQRLFSARKKIRSEVDEMYENLNKPISLDKIEYVIYGTGNPGWSDPRNVCTRQFSKHILWLCHIKPMTAGEIAEKLHVPTVYVEEELEILAAGEYGKYGLLRKQKNGRFAVNFILLDRDTVEAATSLYKEQLPAICSKIADFIKQNKDAYLSFPYLNRKVDLNLILWQQIFVISQAFCENVEKILREKYFADTGNIDRPFSVFGHIDIGKYYGAGWDGADAENVCGYTKLHLENIYITRIKPHFHCGLNVATDAPIQMALRGIDGLDSKHLTETEKEHAAKAVENGYLYREGEMLYTKILVNDMQDRDNLFKLSEKLKDGCFNGAADLVAEKIAAMIRRTVPEHLLPEWKFFNCLAGLPVLDSLVEALIEQNILIPPQDGIGAEGCWMSVSK